MLVEWDILNSCLACVDFRCINISVNKKNSQTSQLWLNFQALKKVGKKSFSQVRSWLKSCVDYFTLCIKEETRTVVFNKVWRFVFYLSPVCNQIQFTKYLFKAAEITCQRQFYFWLTILFVILDFFSLLYVIFFL